MGREGFQRDALAAVERGDFEAIEGLRFEVVAEDLPPLVGAYPRLSSWDQKRNLAELLGQHTDPAVVAVMHDLVKHHPPAGDDGEWAALATAVSVLSGDPNRWGDLFGDRSLLQQELDAWKAKPAPPLASVDTTALLADTVRAAAAALSLPAGTPERQEATRAFAAEFARLRAARPDAEADLLAHAFGRLGVPIGAALVDVSGLLDEAGCR